MAAIVQLTTEHSLILMDEIGMSPTYPPHLLFNFYTPQNKVWGGGFGYIVSIMIGLLSSRSHNPNMTFSFELPIPFTTNLGLVAYHQKLDCLMKRLDCSVVVKVEVTGRVQNSSECSSG